MKPTETAMRAVLLLQGSRLTTMGDVADLFRDRFGLSRAQAYRLAGSAFDVLGRPRTPRKGGMEGKMHTDATRRKISRAATAQWRVLTYRDKVTAALKGRKWNRP